MNERPSSAVLWFTGLSGAGKTTLASALDRRLRCRGVRTEYLDGDAVRLFSPAGFSREERDAHVRRVGFLASCLERHDVTVICALISPYAEARNAVRVWCTRFIEIYVSTPIEVCEARDVKGLYAKARKGQVTHFTGIDDPYEPPQSPEVVIDTSSMTVDQAVDRILECLDDTAVRAEWDDATPLPGSRDVSTPVGSGRTATP
jgi:adenylylsulfate kinase